MRKDLTILSLKGGSRSPHHSRKRRRDMNAQTIPMRQLSATVPPVFLVVLSTAFGIVLIVILSKGV
jgi:hypothetical protein